MNAWEDQIYELFEDKSPINHRYELRPGKQGPSLYCSTCSKLVVIEFDVYLDEMVAEAQAHEKSTHNR